MKYFYLAIIASLIICVSIVNYYPVIQVSASEILDNSWTRYSGNPVLDKGEMGTWDAGGVAAKSLVKVDNTFYLYYQGDNGSGMIGIGVATSKDLIHWDKSPHNPILTRGSSWESAWVGMPCVIYDGRWKMLYEGCDGTHSQIGMATSNNGITWTKYGRNPVLTIGEIGSWDAGSVGTPSIVKVDKKYYVYYVATDGTVYTNTGLATSHDLITFNKETNPVLRRNAGQFDSQECSLNSIIYMDNQFIAMLSGYDGINWSIGYAHSDDGIHFEKYSHNPLFMCGSEWESSHVQLPLLFYNSGEYYMFYAGAGTYFSEGFATRSR